MTAGPRRSAAHPAARPAARPLALLEPLAAPVLWIAHFMVVYLFAEGACAAGGRRWFGADAVHVLTLGATVVGAGLAGAVTWRAWRVWRRRREPSDLAEQRAATMHAAFLLGLLFTAAIVAQGVPALFLRACP